MRQRYALLLCSLVGLASCVGIIGDSGDERAAAAAFAPAEPTLHRLTRPQLQNAWLDLFGHPLAVPGDLPVDDVLYGFSSISASRSTIAPVDAEKYEKATYEVLDQVFADPARRDALVGCPVTAVGEPCVKDFIASFTTRAWRRPASEEEVASLQVLSADVATDLVDAAQGLKFALAAVLLSPHFLFRVEVGEPADAGYRYTSWEMASRLSFLLLDAPPDETLREAARRGELATAEGVRAQASRLLDDPRARVTLTRFFRDFMNIGKLDALDKQPEKFPQLSATLGPSMRVEMERMFENIVFEKEGDFRDMFTTRDTYVNEELARVYGIEGVTGPEWMPVTLPDDGQRAGILTTPGFLALNAHKTQTSPTHRGRFVRLNLFCQDIPPPPPGINTTLPEPEPDKPTTLRQRLDEHRTNAECAGCHERMDPIGFAFEKFDAIGAYREVDENGLPVDSSTEVDGHAVAGPIDMAELVASLPEVGACIARRFYEHAGAHLAGKGDKNSVEELVTDFVASDYRFKDLVLALVTNDGYRYASKPSQEEVKP
ncbi:DUF1592 domain-containing protein [Polyangium sp. 6x1]|uniref:DUF1592 domain-containing protein n=1 Tax=Polyangium sp. 6x1 TaxID=3042689 RepID=UPI0024826B4C|nr:DUF1592 domain-containing protein [Polyangium sp. 6x1]MDI1450086.1 DUF1592 domain-containing protein [Polyangium sp. 6x1]